MPYGNNHVACSVDLPAVGHLRTPVDWSKSQNDTYLTLVSNDKHDYSRQNLESTGAVLEASVDDSVGSTSSAPACDLPLVSIAPSMVAPVNVPGSNDFISLKRACETDAGPNMPRKCAKCKAPGLTTKSNTKTVSKQKDSGGDGEYRDDKGDEHYKTESSNDSQSDNHNAKKLFTAKPEKHIRKETLVPHLCQYCGKPYSRGYDTKRHEGSCPLSTGTRNIYVCEMCVSNLDPSIRSRGQLRRADLFIRHMRVQHGENWDAGMVDTRLTLLPPDSNGSTG
ncbi:hypothetical protein CONPUDRAFT_73933 [Coniophora puteana RWD-64-598 SS2]|uniref:Uncharacterized protein n=1 Tax=Coniophora puteana (strain RWD-64-598) TaxID=741705 RepID=A0A5M3MKL7_CONPW|nr:uncharacterized protein CONPUDRAFT_73933 [Coniophora puteana RWD-64-598 SS2]EIW79510.1 hypothetical protein CONPUDRAFT_73933 [Coniophora puteana RWD-64-598 SS2]